MDSESKEVVSQFDEAKVAKLPQEGVHCFPASGKQIKSRRCITIPLIVVFLVLSVFFIVGKNSSVVLASVSILGFVISILVFVHTFLINKYRIAVDYNEKNVVLRYRFSRIMIPFENFDARDGVPDRAEAMINNSAIGSGEKVYYLVLDNVLEDACYQTTTKDLASREDFFKLKEEAFAIADAYCPRSLSNAIKPESGSQMDSLLSSSRPDIDSIVENVNDAKEVTDATEADVETKDETKTEGEA